MRYEGSAAKHYVFGPINPLANIRLTREGEWRPFGLLQERIQTLFISSLGLNSYIGVLDVST